ncbi:hypothetical protein JCM1393_02950 [Clostridium carnis]
MRVIKKYSENINGVLSNIGNKLKFLNCKNDNTYKSISKGNFKITKDSKIVYSQFTFSLCQVVENKNLKNEEIEELVECEIIIRLKNKSFEVYKNKILICNKNKVYSESIDITNILSNINLNEEKFLVEVKLLGLNIPISLFGGWNIISVCNQIEESKKFINVYSIEENDEENQRIYLDKFITPYNSEVKGKLAIGLWKNTKDKLTWNIDVDENKYILESSYNNISIYDEGETFWGILNTNISGILSNGQENLLLVMPGNRSNYNISSIGIEIEINDLLEDNNTKEVEKVELIKTVPIYKDINTKSIVIIIKNSNMAISYVKVTMRDLSSEPYEEVTCSKTLAFGKDVGYMVTSPPKIYEIEIKGDINNLTIWCAERENNGDEPLDNSVFIKDKNFLNKDFKIID